jgi:NAD(P)-dependent dehydrogenase (short-subunit alcohol dehydrogenase family)
MSDELTGKVALITGAASGIGRATALMLASKGAAVVVADIQEGAGRETVQQIEGAGGRAAFVRADVSDSQAVDAMVRAAVETFGGLDILHANAGHAGFDKALVDHADSEWNLVMAINLTGVFRCCRAAIPAIAKRGGGSLILTSSVAGIHAAPYTGAYNVSKAGVISLTKTLAMECAPLGIRVNAIAPGQVDTPMWAQNEDEAEAGDEGSAVLAELIPLGRMATAEEVAECVSFLVSDAGRYLTGEVLTIDGGMMAGFNFLMPEPSGDEA